MRPDTDCHGGDPDSKQKEVPFHRPWDEGLESKRHGYPQIPGGGHEDEEEREEAQGQNDWRKERRLERARTPPAIFNVGRVVISLGLDTRRGYFAVCQTSGIIKGRSILRIDQLGKKLPYSLEETTEAPSYRAFAELVVVTIVGWARHLERTQPRTSVQRAEAEILRNALHIRNGKFRLSRLKGINKKAWEKENQ
jgi:hypothetical protein